MEVAISSTGPIVTETNIGSDVVCVCQPQSIHKGMDGMPLLDIQLKFGNNPHTPY